MSGIEGTLERVRGHPDTGSLVPIRRECPLIRKIPQEKGMYRALMHRTLAAATQQHPVIGYPLQYRVPDYGTGLEVPAPFLPADTFCRILGATGAMPSRMTTPKA